MEKDVEPEARNKQLSFDKEENDYNQREEDKKDEPKEKVLPNSINIGSITMGANTSDL